MDRQDGPLRAYLTAITTAWLLAASATALAEANPASHGRSMDPAKAKVVEHWTSARRASAIPRDLVIGSRGLGYLRHPDGTLQPYGHQIAADSATHDASPNARPSGGSGDDTTAPSISEMDPADGDTIGASHTLSAHVTDNVGVKSVTFTIQYPDGSTTQNFNADPGANDTWSVTLSGFTDGAWSWGVVAKDTAKRGGNVATSGPASFTVATDGAGGDTSGDTGGNDGTVANAEWTSGGDVQTAAGRLYFEMPSNAKWKGPWTGYVCSGTVVQDNTTGRSIILTAAHCVYDDENKAFARNVLFIPDQAGTDGSGTDLNCYNDPLGCWVPSFGVVDIDWTMHLFPDNVEWDYAYYVVSDTGAHEGAAASSDSLEAAADALSIEFGLPPNDMPPDNLTHALGYSYDFDPLLMYCADDMTTEGMVNWWLPGCGLSGGSSGGPWLQPVDGGSGPVISVNSWGYIGSPGMAGPKLHGTSAECVFNTAISATWGSVLSMDGEAGIAQQCP